jgi:hypothetical protein
MRCVSGVALLVGACSSGTPTIDEGCASSLSGASLLNGSPDVLERIDCYRGFLGLPHMTVSSGVQAAAEAHANWLEVNDVLGSSPKVDVRDWQGVVSEVEGTDGYTGLSAYDRNAKTGVTIAGGLPTSIWGLFRFQADVDPDQWIMEPGVRDALFQPKVLGVGEATVTLGGVERAYTDVFAAIPSGTRLLRPVVYPKDGQEDVPPAWTPLVRIWDDKLTNHQWIGFPITITMGGDKQGHVSINPFQLTVVSATLTNSDDEEVPIRIILPTGSFAGALRTTIVLAPNAPLAVDTEYRVDAEITSLFGTTVVHSRFRTAGSLPDTDAPDTGGADTDAPDTDAP